MRAAIVGATLLCLAIALAACSGGEEPDTVKPVVEVSPKAVPTVAFIDDAVATPAAIEETAPVTTPPPAVRETGLSDWKDSLYRRWSEIVDAHGTWLRPMPLPHVRYLPGPLSLEELEARQAKGERLEDRWRRVQGLQPAHPYSGALVSLDTIPLYVDGPLLPNHFRVVGVDECLTLGAEPSPDAAVINCLPIRTGASLDAAELDCMAEGVLLQDQGGDVITDDGVTWLKVRTPAGIEGWSSSRYLE